MKIYTIYKKIMIIMMCSILLLSQTVVFASDEVEKNQDNILASNQAVSKVVSKEESKTDIMLISSSDVNADSYEPNDTRETATDYNIVTQLHGNAFNEGYRNANHHTSTDVDYYYVTLTAGNLVFVDLRNISATREWNIQIERDNGDGTITQWTMTEENQEIQRGTNERFFYFVPDISGKYYVKVSGSGEPDNFYYFMYVGNAKRTVTFERDTNCTLKLYGGQYYESEVFNGTKLYYYPKYAVINSMELSNDFYGGYCSKITKRITQISTGSSYFGLKGATRISNISGKYIAQKWRIEGMCSCGKSHATTTWTPKIKVQFSYTAGPLPDNSVK